MRTDMTVNEFLNKFWRTMRDDNSNEAKAQAAGAIAALKATGQLNALEAEAWATRMEHCPGHDDEGGRVWCAYCGNLEGRTNDA